MAKKKPIKRYDLFFTEEDLKLQIALGREYYASDINDKVILYRVNIVETITHSLYGETKSGQKKFLPAIELSVLVNMTDSATKYLSDGGITRQDIANLTFNIYNQELEELNCQLTIGDVVEYNHGDRIRYYEITSLNNISSTKQTMGGKSPYYKSVVCAPVKGDFVLPQ